MTKNSNATAVSPSLAIVGTGGTANPVNETPSAPKTDARGEPVRFSDYIAAKQAANNVGSLSVIQNSKQLLAQFIDETAKAGTINDEAAGYSNRASFMLFTALHGGVISEDQVKGAMGDVFGYKPKKDGTPGATVNKAGDAINKRVVRAAQLATFIESEGENKPGIFKDTDLTPDSDNGSDKDLKTLHSVYQDMKAGKTPLFTVYEQIAKIKANAKPKASMAYDAVKISSLADDLASLDVSVAAVMANASLRLAYVKLIAIWDQVDLEAGRVAMERDAA